MDATMLAMATAAAVKAQPWERDSASQAAATMAMRARASMGLGHEALAETDVAPGQPAKGDRAAGQPSRPERRAQRW